MSIKQNFTICLFYTTCLILLDEFKAVKQVSASMSFIMEIQKKKISTLEEMLKTSSVSARFYALLEENFRRLLPYYQTIIGTFKKYQNELKHALELSYSNEPLECLNNHIKVLKRNASGFRNFYNVKLRIYLQFGVILFSNRQKNLEGISSRNHDNRFHSLVFLHQHQLTKSLNYSFLIKIRLSQQHSLTHQR